MSIRRLSLNAVLLRPDVELHALLGDTSQLEVSYYEWRDGILEPLEDVAALAPALVPGDVVIALLRGVSGTPPWQQFIEDACGLEDFALGPRPTRGAILFCAVADPITTEITRWVAFTFGSASQAVRRDRVEPRFGLIAALNRLVNRATATGETVGLREIHFTTFGAYRHRTGQRAARDTPLDAFRISRIADLLDAVGGTGGRDPEQVFGARPLRSRDAVEVVEDLVDIANAGLADYRSNVYKADFAFVDDYVVVENAATRTAVLETVCSDLTSGVDSLDVFIPDDLVPFESDHAIHFIALPGKVGSKATDTNLSVEMIRRLVERDGTQALSATLRFLDAAHIEIAHATVMECIAAEVTYGSTTYILSDGAVFEVDRTFLDRIHAHLDGIEHTTLKLPPFKGGGEPRWNKEAAKDSKDLILLDGQMIRVAGQTPFEAADLVHRAGTLIHAKRKGRSSAMGHLFVQARQSTQFLVQFEEARSQLERLVLTAAGDEALGKAAAQSLGALQTRPAGLEVVLAILGDWRTRTLVHLPLLAKIELVETVQQISQHGFGPTVALVSAG